MIDFHCHIDLYEDPRAVVAESVRRHCSVLAVTTTPLAWHGTKQVVADAPHIQVGLGLHPELVPERFAEVETFEALVETANFIGEIGLDGSPRFRSTLPLQLEVLRAMLTMISKAGGRVISMHSRGAVSEILSELERHSCRNVPVLHWFSGSETELRGAIELGCWFSVGPAMLRTEKGRKLVALMPMERVLTETDGPFARNGQSPLFPWDVAEAEHLLTDIWRTSSIETQGRLRLNFRELVTRHPAKR